MTVEDYRVVLKRLDARRRDIESELAERSVRLSVAGVGMDGSLLDAEGFPRADIDVTAIRADRHRIMELRTDYRVVSDEIEQALHSLHAANPPARPASPLAAPSTFASAPLRVPEPAPTQPWEELVAFAVAERVAEGSPADRGGVCVGDELLRFHTTTALNGGIDPIARMAEHLPSLENKETHLLVLRAGKPIDLTVTPQKWPGRGLLGVFWRLIRHAR